MSVREVDDATFEHEVLKSDRPVLVDFWAVWCAPCRMLAPTIEAIAEKYNDTARVVRLNVDENPSITQRYGIKGIPTLIFYEDGFEINRIVGATSKDAISRVIDNALNRRSSVSPNLEKQSQPVQKAPTIKQANEYDVFISYRRQDAAEPARLIRSELRHQNLRIFLDVDDLQPGHFDQVLLNRIANTANFIVILTPHCLDHCSEEGDWLRQEIAQAVKTNRNIIPVMMPAFQFPNPQTLPEDIRVLRTYHSVSYSHEFFDAMLNRIVQYLQ